VVFARILTVTGGKPITMAIQAMFSFQTDIGMVMAMTCLSLVPGVAMIWFVRGHLARKASPCGHELRCPPDHPAAVRAISGTPAPSRSSTKKAANWARPETPGLLRRSGSVARAPCPAPRRASRRSRPHPGPSAPEEATSRSAGVRAQAWNCCVDHIAPSAPARDIQRLILGAQKLDRAAQRESAEQDAEDKSGGDDRPRR
jgi:hypothetical protein